MKAYRIEPFNFLETHRLTLKRYVNSHSVLEIEGIINEDLEQEYINYCVSNKYPQLKMYIAAEKTEQVFFDGFITQFNIKREGRVCLLSLEVKSGTYMMDLNEHLRFYQDKNQPYKDIIDEIGNTYSNCNFMIKDKNIQTLNNFTIQYLETDWQFLKRLASRYRSVLIPADRVPGIHFFMGIPQLNIHELKDEDYILTNEIQDCQSKKSELKLNQADFISYNITNREIYYLADKVIFNGNELYVYGIRSELMHGELIHHYLLKTKDAFQVLYAANSSMIGASFNAVISDVVKDKVLIELTQGENKLQAPVMEFPFSTMYSSADGTGWYCMPEKGDSARLYIPSQNESDAYVTSAVHQKSSDSNARTNPDIKSLKTRYGKEIYFTQDRIVMTNHKGDQITIHDKKGISIESSKNITMRAKGDISLTSMEQTLTMNAADQIDIGQGGSRLVIDDDIAFKGGKLRME
ncbi:contractile injection system protein, VgrG/Pvc8 family [Lacrimispora xylanisolvens]|uniref:contractile injection system protein, VgrG/Pvc8 family n=1 Tax=Lacrimispora xylanisolvens TaxID=384636 RepID=UPI0024029DC2